MGPKPKSKEEVLAQKRERERLRYQTIKSTPELFAKYQRNNKIKYEKLKEQKKVLHINYVTSNQRKIQQKKWREQRRRRYQLHKDKKENERELNTENSLHKICFEQVQLDASKEQENVFVMEPFCDSMGSCETTHLELNIENSPLSGGTRDVEPDHIDTSEGKEFVFVMEPFCETTHEKVIIKEETLCEKKMVKPKPKSEEELLAQKRERARLRYQKIKSNPVLYAEYQKNQKVKYKKLKEQKKVLLIHEMTPRQRKIQQKKWREERRRRYQRNKDIKAKEGELNTENNLHESCLDQVQLDASKVQENVFVMDPLCVTTHGTVIIKEEQLFEKKMFKPIPKSREEVLAQKKERERMRYQKIKDNPVLYTEYQRNNKMKYEKLKEQKKVLLINEMTPRQRKIQQKKWREERRRRYQRNKDKKAKERELNTENNLHESCFDQVQLDASKEQENVFVMDPLCETTHETVIIKEELLCEKMYQPKPKSKEEVLAQKREKERLRYQTIKSNPELYAEYQRNNKMKYEKLKGQKKVLHINEMTPRQRKIQQKKWREERRRRYQRNKDNKAKETELNTENSPHESGVEPNQIGASEGHENVTKEPFCETGSCDITRDTVVIKLEPMGEEGSCASYDPLTSLYPDHEVKEELVLGPESLQRPGAPAAVYMPVDEATSTARGPPTDTRNPQSGQESPSTSKCTPKPSNTPKKHSCETCGKEFKRGYDLKCHMFTHTGLKPYTCEICKKEFRFVSNLIPHRRIHTRERPFPCDICKMSFVNSGALKNHKRIHSGVKPYSCEICYKTFRVPDTLNRHKRTHSGEKPYLCKICNKGFNDTGCLKKHERIHTGEQPYACEMCEKKFTQLSNLKSHRRIHTGEKPYACEICERKFSQLINLKKHEKIHTRETTDSNTKSVTDNHNSSLVSEKYTDGKNNE